MWLGQRTFAVEYFFSVPTTAPLLCAAFSALFPLIVVSFCPTPDPRTLLPILVTDSQSSLILSAYLGLRWFSDGASAAGLVETLDEYRMWEEEIWEGKVSRYIK